MSAIEDWLENPKQLGHFVNGVYFSGRKELRAELDAKDVNPDGSSVRSFVIAHEYGHHIDYESNNVRFRTWSEDNDFFKDAINKDKKQFKGSFRAGKYRIKDEEFENLHKKIGTYETVERYSKYNPEELLVSYKTTTLKADGFGEVSDIIDALALGKFQKNYGTWGHGVSYYRRRGAVEKEIFANLFAIRHNKKAYDVAKSIIPNTVKEFEKRLDELEKQ